MDRKALTPVDAHAALTSLPDWRGAMGALRTVVELPSGAQAAALVARIGQVADELDHHPDVDWRHRLVFVSTTTHSAGYRVSAYDVELAHRVTALATAAGALMRPSLVRSVEIAVDTRDAAAVSPTWQAALGYVAVDGALRDPHGRGPSVWFQETDDPAPSRLHLDVSVASEVAQDVVAAAQAAGGRVDRSFEPSWTVVTDAAGDRVCVCTPQGRADPTN